MMHMLYKINNGCIRYNAQTIIDNINIEIKDAEKIAIIGNNGCGKTSLLKLISNEIGLSKRDSDEDIYIEKYGKISIGYLKQISDHALSCTLQDEIDHIYEPMVQMIENMDRLVEQMERDPSEETIMRYSVLQEEFFRLGGYDYANDLDYILSNLGFTSADYKKKICEFSGGERTKIELAKVILSKPDIMLLDEPTNHLDQDMTEWLENYISHYDKAAIIVSHDRMFLDKVADKIYEIEHKTVKEYKGNYTDFVRQKKKNYEIQLKMYEEQQKQIERLKDIAERFKHIPSKSAMAKAKLKYIERMEKIERPRKDDLSTFYTNLAPAKKSGKEVFRAEKLNVGYDSNFFEISFVVEKGQKIACIGKNGVGKSTLLKTMMGLVKPVSGTFQWGNNADVGYFDQHAANVGSERTVLDEFWNEYPKLSQNEVRSYLGAFLFRQDEVYKNVKDLSGGERARLNLAKIFKRKPNVLLLDEPTNHMDLLGKETLENMLAQFTGTVVFVTHDRYFVKKIATALLIFNEDGVTYFKGSYDEYKEKVKNA